MIKDYEPLILGLIDAFLLLELSGSDEIDPDTAVRGMENIASSLLAMSNADQLELRGALMRIGAQSEDSTYRSFVEGLPDMIGLA